MFFLNFSGFLSHLQTIHFQNSNRTSVLVPFKASDFLRWTCPWSYWQSQRARGAIDRGTTTVTETNPPGQVTPKWWWKVRDIQKSREKGNLGWWKKMVIWPECLGFKTRRCNEKRAPGCFKYFLFSPLVGEDSYFGSYFNWIKTTWKTDAQNSPMKDCKLMTVILNFPFGWFKPCFFAVHYNGWWGQTGSL